MEFRTLGRSGIKVSRLFLGAMMFGPWGNPDHDECLGTVHQALDAGLNFIDTADVYGGDESERIVGEIRHPAATSAIIGPRTPDQLADLPSGADVSLDETTLDRIDEIVPPGTTLDEADSGYTPPALSDPALRRRPARG